MLRGSAARGWCSFVLEDLPKHAGVPDGVACPAQLLRGHLTQQGVAAEAIEPLTTTLGLGPHWTRYLELLASDDGATAGFAIREPSSELLPRLTAVLACCEIDSQVATRMLALAESAQSARCMLRFMFSRGESRPEVSVIQRRPLALEQGLQLLGAGIQAIEQVRTCTALLRQASLHGVAITARPRDPQWRGAVRFAHLVTPRRRETARMRLAHAASRFAPCAAAVSCWAERHDGWLAREHTLLSLWLQLAMVDPATVSIEYPDVAVPAAGLLEPGSAEIHERFEQLSFAAGRATLSYLEVSLQQARLPRLHAAACLNY